MNAPRPHKSVNKTVSRCLRKVSIVSSVLSRVAGRSFHRTLVDEVSRLFIARKTNTLYGSGIDSRASQRDDNVTEYTQWSVYKTQELTTQM